MVAKATWSCSGKSLLTPGQVRKQRRQNGDAYMAARLSFIQSRTPVHGTVLPPLRVSLPSSLKCLWKHPYRHSLEVCLLNYSKVSQVDNDNHHKSMPCRLDTNISLLTSAFHPWKDGSWPSPNTKCTDFTSRSPPVLTVLILENTRFLLRLKVIT